MGSDLIAKATKVRAAWRGFQELSANTSDGAFDVGAAQGRGGLVCLRPHESQSFCSVTNRPQIGRSEALHQARHSFRIQSRFDLHCPEVLAKQLAACVSPRQTNFDLLGETTATEHARINVLRMIRSADKENPVFSLQAADFHQELIDNLDVVLA